MSQIFWTEDYNSVDLPRDSTAVWLHHKSEKVAAERTVDLQGFLENPKKAVEGATLLVVCSLVSKLCTPSNRVKLGQFLTEPWFGPERVSVDRMLFKGKPWRAWWHFGCVGKPFAGCTTSFALEGRYSRWEERRGGNPCELETFVRDGKRVVQYRSGFCFDRFEVRVEPMPEDVRREYAEEKERAFAECPTICKIVARLEAFAQKVYPSRMVPDDIFKARDVEIVATDLPIDNFLIEDIREKVELTNRCAEEFAC